MKRAADILRSIMNDQEARRAGEWSSFFKGWEAVAGNDIAAHSAVRDVKQGTVIIEVDHPGWLQMLQMRKVQILSKMQQRYPALEIKDMRVFLSDGEYKETRSAGETVESENENPKAARSVPESEEYHSFQAMLKRLRKGQQKQH